MIFNYDAALERFMGEKDILLEVLPSYLENLDNCINEIKDLDPQSQCKRIRELAHSIKGSSLNLDVIDLGRAAESLEDSAYNSDFKAVPKQIDQLIKYAAQAKIELQKYVV